MINRRMVGGHEEKDGGKGKRSRMEGEGMSRTMEGERI